MSAYISKSSEFKVSLKVQVTYLNKIGRAWLSSWLRLRNETVESQLMSQKRRENDILLYHNSSKIFIYCFIIRLLIPFSPDVKISSCSELFLEEYAKIK